MAGITLIIGGCRSGKSRYAQRLAERLGERRLFIATAPVVDDEMRRRVARHREMRRGRGWDTIEENIHLAQCLRDATNHEVVLCDCLTLWVGNLQFAASQEGSSLEEETIVRHSREVCRAARSISARVLFVTNEVGMGIVPGDEYSRRFRDLAGRCNQEMAAAADSVTLLVSGLSHQLKGEVDDKP